MTIDRQFRQGYFKFYQRRFKYCWFVNGFYYVYGFCPCEKEHKLYIIFYKILNDSAHEEKEYLIKIEDKIFFDKLNNLGIDINRIGGNLYSFHKEFQFIIQNFIEFDDA